MVNGELMIALMGKYIKVCRCKECGKIYGNGLPYICSKCGAELGRPTPMRIQMMGFGDVTLTKNCETVIARKGVFGWKVREKPEPEVKQE